LANMLLTKAKNSWEGMDRLSRYSKLYLLHIRLGLTKTGQGSRIEAIARGIPTLIVPGKAISECNVKQT